MKLEYDFDTHTGEIVFHCFDERMSDGDIVILLRTIDPKVRSIRIKVEGEHGAMLVHSRLENKWTAWRGSGQNPTKRVHLSFGAPRYV